MGIPTPMLIFFNIGGYLGVILSTQELAQEFLSKSEGEVWLIKSHNHAV